MLGVLFLRKRWEWGGSKEVVVEKEEEEGKKRRRLNKKKKKRGGVTHLWSNHRPQIDEREWSWTLTK